MQYYTNQHNYKSSEKILIMDAVNTCNDNLNKN